MISDIRVGLRLLWRDRAYAVTAALTLALCIGANTALFSVVHHVLLKPLPVPESGRIVLMSNAYPKAGAAAAAGGYSGAPDYFDRLRETDVYEEQAAFNGGNQSIDLKRGKLEAQKPIGRSLRSKGKPGMADHQTLSPVAGGAKRHVNHRPGSSGKSKRRGALVVGAFCCCRDRGDAGQSWKPCTRGIAHGGRSRQSGGSAIAWQISRRAWQGRNVQRPVRHWRAHRFNHMPGRNSDRQHGNNAQNPFTADHSSHAKIPRIIFVFDIGQSGRSGGFSKE